MRDHMDELVNLRGFCCTAAYRVQQLQRRSSVEEPQMIPAFELAIEPIGHGEDLIKRTIRHPPPQLWGYEVPDEHTVKGVAPDGDPIRAEDMACSRRAGIWRGRHL